MTDKAAMVAAQRLARPEAWLELGYDPQRERLWGEYEGREHYRVFASVVPSRNERSIGCECGSPRNPCKHVLALRLIAARQYNFPDRPMPASFVNNAATERPVYPSRWRDG